jgi:predicted nuclease of predicted toxin-antitoxin system
MKIIVDMNLSPDWCNSLIREGFDAVHWSSLGDPSAHDGDIFNYAKINGYVIFTHDLDFSVLLARTRDNGPSVIQLRTRDTFPDKFSSAVITAIRQHSREISEGAIVTIDLIKARVRTLTIR